MGPGCSSPVDAAYSTMGWALQRIPYGTRSQSSACRLHVGHRKVCQACPGSSKRGCVTIRRPWLAPGEASRQAQEAARPVVRSPRPEKGETGHIPDQGDEAKRWGRDPRVRDLKSGFFFHCQQTLGKGGPAIGGPWQAWQRESGPGGDSSPGLRR